jgi:peptidyl-prolyl cis-trans isomerase C
MEYERVRASAPDQEEYRVRHILVTKQEQALDAMERLRRGELFGSVARGVSEDLGSRDQGGELGWNVPETFVEEFAATMRTLKPHGLASEPTKTKYGWHVIEVLEVKLGKETFPRLVDVHDMIEARLLRNVSANH